MKRFVALACFGLSLTCASGQGLINFMNNVKTLVSVGPPTSVWAGELGSYYFALLTSPVGADNFTFAGVYATNQAVAGRLFGGVGVAVSGWVPGTARDWEVFGWSANCGTTFNPAWLSGLGLPPGALVGLSGIGTGVVGGPSLGGLMPNLNIFGGVGGIQNGFVLTQLIPEPASLGLAALGAVTLLILRCRTSLARCRLKKPSKPASSPRPRPRYLRSP